MSRQRVRLAHASVDPLPSKQHRERVGTLDPMALRIGLLYTASECADARPRRGASSKERFLSVLATANTSSLSPFSLRPPPPTLPSISEGVTGRPGACAPDEPSPTTISPEDGRRGPGKIGG